MNGPMRSDQKRINTSYEPFSQEPEYAAANRGFVESLDLAGAARFLDLACGTGAIAEIVRGLHPGLAVVGLDMSHEQLLLAREHAVRPLTRGARPLFVEGSANHLPLHDGDFDAVVMANAIHLFGDPSALLREVARVLRVGGLFALNTSFYAGTFVPGTERFYHEWMRQALNAAKGAASGADGGRVPRQRGRVGRAFSNRWRTPAEWASALGQHGFEVQKIHERPVTMDQRCFEAIGAYAGFAEVLLSGFPVTVASQALRAGVGPALATVGVREIPRLWLEVAAILRRRSAAR